MTMQTESKIQSNTYVPYEYMTITIDKTMQPVYQDTLSAFGWEVESIKDGRRTYHPLPFIFLKRRQQTTITLKRNRRLANRASVITMQEKVELSLDKIARLERSKKRSGAIAGAALGVLGCVPLATSVFMITAATTVAVPAVMVGVVGIALWVGAGASYHFLNRRRIEKVRPLIDDEFNNLYLTLDEN